MNFDRRAVAWGVVFVLLGVLFLLHSLDVIELRAAVIWPILLIALGLAVLVGSSGPAQPS